MNYHYRGYRPAMNEEGFVIEDDWYAKMELLDTMSRRLGERYAPPTRTELKHALTTSRQRPAPWRAFLLKLRAALSERFFRFHRSHARNL